MRRVLLPFDFSPQSRRALALALSGVPFGPDVLIDALHVVDPRLYEKRLPGLEPPTEDALKSYFKAEVARASTPERRVKEDPTFSVVRGKPAAEILGRVNTCGGIMMGGQGHGGVSEAFLGTTAMRVVREAPVSVYVVKKTSVLATPARVMCGVDADGSSGQALKDAAAFCKACGASLSLLRTITVIPTYALYPAPVPNMSAPMIDTERDRLISFELETLKESFAQRHTVTINAGGVAQDIVNQAALDRIDTIVVGAHDRGTGARLLLGSVSESVVQRSASDVYVVR